MTANTQAVDRQIVQAAHVLSRLGLVSAFGHVSVRTRTGFCISLAADLGVVDVGQVVSIPAGAHAEAWVRSRSAARGPMSVRSRA